MCPFCISTATIVIAGAVSATGIGGLLATKMGLKILANRRSESFEPQNETQSLTQIQGD